MQQQKPGALAGVSSLLDGSGMVRVPPGEFSMGSNDGNPDEVPTRRIRITKPFEIGKYEVTQAQWEGVVRDAHMSADVKTNFSHFQGLDLPVESVSWEDVQDFLKRLNSRSETHVFRLPTEAEWEFASLGGSASARGPSLADAAWFEENAEAQTHVVGQKRPNGLGLYDMFGNVAEWVQDWYAREYETADVTDPQGPPMGSYKVYRGGCWFDPAKNLRPAYRGFDFPSSKFYNVGFRVVRTPKA